MGRTIKKQAAEAEETKEIPPGVTVTIKVKQTRAVGHQLIRAMESQPAQGAMEETKILQNPMKRITVAMQGRKVVASKSKAEHILKNHTLLKVGWHVTFEDAPVYYDVTWAW